MRLIHCVWFRCACISLRVSRRCMDSNILVHELFYIFKLICKGCILRSLFKSILYLVYFTFIILHYMGFTLQGFSGLKFMYYRIECHFNPAMHVMNVISILMYYFKFECTEHYIKYNFKKTT